MKMRVPVRFIQRGTETPDAVGAGNAMSKSVGHQPVERAVKGHSVVLDGGCRERRRDLVVRQRTACTAEDVEHRDPGPRCAPTTLGNAHGAANAVARRSD